MTRHVWELKPISNRNQGPLRDRAEAQVTRYLQSGNRTTDPSGQLPGTCGGWTRGDGSDLFMDGTRLGYLRTLGNVYEITLRHDTAENSGLIFYEYHLVESWQDRLSQQIRDALSGENRPFYFFAPGPFGFPVPL